MPKSVPQGTNATIDQSFRRISNAFNGFPCRREGKKNRLISRLPFDKPAWLSLPRVFARTMEGRRCGLFEADIEVIVDDKIICGPANLRRFARPRRSSADLHFLAWPRQRTDVRVSGRERQFHPGRAMLQFVFDGHLVEKSSADFNFFGEFGGPNGIG